MSGCFPFVFCSSVSSYLFLMQEKYIVFNMNEGHCLQKSKHVKISSHRSRKQPVLINAKYHSFQTDMSQNSLNNTLSLIYCVDIYIYITNISLRLDENSYLCRNLEYLLYGNESHVLTETSVLLKTSVICN